jgi:oligopeptide/dipeptide ABC transporter ATP-binding protein
VPVASPVGRESRKRVVLKGDPPSPVSPPSGCRFRTRCWKAQDICAREEPALRDRTGAGLLTACHFPEPLGRTPPTIEHKEAVV